LCWLLRCRRATADEPRQHFLHENRTVLSPVGRRRLVVSAREPHAIGIAQKQRRHTLAEHDDAPAVVDVFVRRKWLRRLARFVELIRERRPAFDRASAAERHLAIGLVDLSGFRHGAVIVQVLRIRRQFHAEWADEVIYSCRLQGLPAFFVQHEQTILRSSRKRRSRQPRQR
jgi:hypothetical protein